MNSPVKVFTSVYTQGSWAVFCFSKPKKPKLKKLQLKKKNRALRASAMRKTCFPRRLYGAHKMS